MGYQTSISWYCCSTRTQARVPVSSIGRLLCWCSLPVRAAGGAARREDEGCSKPRRPLPPGPAAPGGPRLYCAWDGGRADPVPLPNEPWDPSLMDWHRLFGLVLTDFFTGSPYSVELEKDLSLKKQLLDVIILRKYPGTFTEPLPEGLEELAAHNLITFKSHQETLDDWTLKELTGHYVNYRKQVSPSLQQLLPEEEF